MRKERFFAGLLCLALLISGCAGPADARPAAPEEPTAAQTEAPAARPAASEEPPRTQPAGEQTLPAEPKAVIVIDPGHQRQGNPDPEPIGPGAQETKAKVTGGTRGCVTGLAEYELTLTVSLLLQEELVQRGYEVVMVRTTHDVDLSNAQRAQIANEAQADAFVRIHGNGFDDPSVHGALTICQKEDNPYNGDLHGESLALSTAVLEELVRATGCLGRKVMQTNTMSGINWCRTPVTIVEMGFMTNPEEDALMATEDYQRKIVVGIAEGIDRYIEERE